MGFLDKFKTKSRPASNVVQLKVKPASKPKPAPFKAEWVKLPVPWIEALRESSNASTTHLAHIILMEAFKQKYHGREIVLSKEVTGMSRHMRARAIRELVKLGLIRIEKRDRQATRVIELYL